MHLEGFGERSEAKNRSDTEFFPNIILYYVNVIIFQI